MTPVMKLTAILTCYNRRESTLACLRRLAESAGQAQFNLVAVLADDGSTDGTAEAVTAEFPWVQVLRGDGSLFWNRGMHMAMAEALRDPESQWLLWLNDDTMLHADALPRLLDTARALQAQCGRPGIVVGATNDRHSGQLSYSGQVRLSRWRRFQFRKVFSPHEATPCSTMNGNVVLLPRAVADDVGNLDPVFAHAMGDIDYGLRATSRGHPIVVAAGFVGECSNNPAAGTHQDASLPLARRWRALTHRKALPFRSWLQLTRRHGGWLWPAYFAWPYLSLLLNGLRRSRSVPTRRVSP
jgi:GT2 family glycosyltransferase